MYFVACKADDIVLEPANVTQRDQTQSELDPGIIQQVH
jgi:hypothetical protein